VLFRSGLSICFVLLATLAAAAKVPLPDDLFRLSVSRDAAGDYRLDWSVAPESYLYRDKIVVTSSEGRGQPLPIETATGKVKDDPTFGATEVYYGAASATVPSKALAATPAILVTYQGCAEIGICYPPVTKSVDLASLAISDAEPSAARQSRVATNEGVTSDVMSLPSGPVSPETGDWRAWISGSFASMLAAFLGFGLLLSFTPCVFPMIPILSGMLARAGEELSASRGFALSAAYVVAMAAAYGVLGVAAAWSGQNLQAALQTPWALGALSLLFVMFALSMFGLFELQLPSAWTSLLSRGSSGAAGSLPSAALLGFTSALIVSPCVTPPLAAALLYVAQTGDTARGAAALFMLGLGMGLPLVVFGTVGARALPKAGPWLVRVKQAFGIVFLAVAIEMISRVAPAQVTLALWAMLAIGTGAFLGAFDTLARSDGALLRVAKATGVMAVLYGAALVVGFAGGAVDPARPLAFLARAPIGASAPEAAAATIITPAQLDAAIDTARAQGKPLVVDFTAEWCVTCKQIEHTVFAHPTVQARLKDVALIRADVTDYSDASRALMQRFGVVGPPTILFLGADGREDPSVRSVGPVDVEGFLQKLSQAGV
jgi:thiol:disulfide interchange protein DsbD